LQQTCGQPLTDALGSYRGQQARGKSLCTSNLLQSLTVLVVRSLAQNERSDFFGQIQLERSIDSLQEFRIAHFVQAIDRRIIDEEVSLLRDFARIRKSF
jgi:hypothetical protein